MHAPYHDILRKVPQRPVWWLGGVPRYEPFSPDSAGIFEIALVHTECQACRTRYDVAVTARPPLFHSLRTVLAYDNSLEIGDPPFACNELGAPQCGAGYCMSSLEIRILEFWCRTTILSEWRRDPDLERPLADWDGDEAGRRNSIQSVIARIYESERSVEWHRVNGEGDFAAIVHILKDFGCERPEEVANMLDLDRRERQFRGEVSALTTERLGKRG